VTPISTQAFATEEESKLKTSAREPKKQAHRSTSSGYSAAQAKPPATPQGGTFLE
jgi:hypothetical protein